MLRSPWVPWFAALAVGLGACRRQAAAVGAIEVWELSGPTMGSSYTVKWHGGAPPDRVRPVVEALLTLVDRTFSNWRQDSEVAAFNANATTAPVPASDLLRAAVTRALALAAATDGAFDPTVKPLSDLFRAKKHGGPRPLAAAVAAARARIGWQHLQVVGATLQKAVPDLALDLDGLVAGLAADRLADALAALGVHDCMLDITGEVLCRGVRPDGAPWRIGIVDPQNATPGAELPLLTVPLRDRALCTSGDYRNFAVVDGGVITHVFDPRTGDNPTHGVVSVSVLARSCALADGLGTALMVLGPGGAASALQRCGEADVAAWFVVADERGNLRGEGMQWPEAFALDGRPRSRPPLDPEQRTRREQDLAAALAAQRDGGATAEQCVWVGRRLGYLGRHKDAIAEYSRGLLAHPDEPHLLRHRGHRYLTVRDFDTARRDLERAQQVVRDQPDEVEPDGQPVPGRPPHSTLHGNIDYHLGLACFCLGDFAAAAAAWSRSLAAANTDEARVAAAHWLWCARMRLADAAGAAAAVAKVGGDLDVVENRSYWQLCRVYRGEVDPATMAAGDDSKGAVIAFGLAHLALVRGDADAPARLQQVAQRPDWPSFGVLAAEAECARLPQGRR